MILHLCVQMYIPTPPPHVIDPPCVIDPLLCAGQVDPPHFSANVPKYCKKHFLEPKNMVVRILILQGFQKYPFCQKNFVHPRPPFCCPKREDGPVLANLTPPPPKLTPRPVLANMTGVNDAGG